MEKRYITSNGVKLYAYANESLHSFCCSLYVKAGPLYESADENGISHFVEHIIVRNMNALMGGNLYRELDRLGLKLTACTYTELMQVTLSGAPETASRAFEIFASIFGELALTADEIALERGRIKAEIREEDDKSTLDYFTNRIVWQGTPLERTITGTRTVIDRIGKKRLAEEKRKLLSSDNVFVYLTGCVSDSDIRKLISEIEKYSVKNTPLMRDNSAVVPKDMFRRSGDIAVKSADNTVVRISFDVNTAKSSGAALMLLYDILFEGDSCKIYQELSEKTGLIYSYSPYLERYKNVGCLYFLYEVAPAKLYDTLSIVAHVIRSVKEGITDELDYVTAPYTKNRAMLLDDPDDLGWNMAYEAHFLGRDYYSVDDSIAEYGKVTPDDIVSLAREIFRPENMTVTLKGNKKTIDTDKIKEIVGKIR